MIQVTPEYLAELREGAARAIELEAENERYRAALEKVQTPVEFWESCNTEFKPAYTALLTIVRKALGDKHE